VGSVLKADCSAADAYARKELFSLPSNFYAQFDLLIPGATMAALDADGARFGADNMEIAVGFDGFFTTPPFTTTSCDYWTDATPNGPFTGLTADAWHTIRYRYNAHAITWTLDGVTFDTYTVTATAHTEFFDFGGQFAHHTAGEIYYVDNVKIGTTPGGTDLFADDFESGTFGAWDSTSGSVSIVTDPLGGGGGGVSGLHATVHVQ
jgi:hypothetical protein